MTTMTKLHTCGPSQCVKLNFDTNVIPHHFTYTSRHTFINTPIIIILLLLLLLLLLVCQTKVAVQRPSLLLLTVRFHSSNLRPYIPLLGQTQTQDIPYTIHPVHNPTVGRVA
jgi:hypothetical protein